MTEDRIQETVDRSRNEEGKERPPTADLRSGPSDLEDHFVLGKLDKCWILDS
jgi:hypothetical protein